MIDFTLLHNKFNEEVIQKINIINQTNENPELILTKNFNKGWTNCLTDLIDRYGDDYTKHNFQEDLYSILIPFLRDKLGYEYEFSFYKGQYPSDICIKYQDYWLGSIDIYNQNFCIRNPLKIDFYKNLICKYIKECNEQVVRLDILTKKGMNPFKICKNLFQYINFIFNYKHFKKARERFIKSLNESIERYKKEIVQFEEKLSKDKIMQKEIEERAQLLKDFFLQYNYKIYGLD